FYRVRIPTNAPVNWNVTFGQQLGDVVMYVRDRVPPGQATTPTDLRDWSDDNKNHGPYPIFDPPGTYTVPCPPMRPGNAYFLGFRAVNDATFSVSCNTNGGSIDYTNAIPFYAGTLPTTSIPGYGILKLRIDVPADAQRLILRFTNTASLYMYLDQGSVPTRTTSDHWYSQGTVNPVLNQPLYNANGWPWQPNYMYFITVTNTSAVAQNFSLGVDGRNCATDDYDGDGLPDCWELSYFPSIYSYGPTHDPDGDGVNNLDEYLEGTVPNDPLSFHPRLQITSQYGSVTRNPAGTLTTNVPPKAWYNLNQTVQLTAVPDPGYAFLSWSGDASGTSNPLSLQMNAHKNVTAVFGITNQPNADYRFQNNLHSSVGTPPDLTDIAVGNTFVSDVVDGNPQTVYRFPQGSGVVLQPATGVIPTNNYTMILLFRYDVISGWRRIIDFKNPVADAGLYQVNGQLNFFGAGAGGPAGAIAVSNYVQVVITRDSTSSNVVGYVNGAQQFTFVDSGNLATLGGSPLWLRFFKDNTTEDAPGAVARIRLY
ncbi:MAG TPA: hypothetical protein VK327_18340, partial [Candidatus Paceibacterota bacterium]|nr:hypothetical protein [Candidatus Paceibacterota bacterium]